MAASETTPAPNRKYSVFPSAVCSHQISFRDQLLCKTLTIFSKVASSIKHVSFCLRWPAASRATGNTASHDLSHSSDPTVCWCHWTGVQQATGIIFNSFFLNCWIINRFSSVLLWRLNLSSLIGSLHSKKKKRRSCFQGKTWVFLNQAPRIWQPIHFNRVAHLVNMLKMFLASWFLLHHAATHMMHQDTSAIQIEPRHSSTYDNLTSHL